MTPSTLLCDTLSKDARSDVEPQLDIMSIMGRWRAPGCRWVYFAERDGLVKIGFSANVDQRMSALHARLLAVMPGGAGMEAQMHALFAKYRVHGEWFHPGLDLVAFIDALHDGDLPRPLDLPADYGKAELKQLVAQYAAEDEAERQRQSAIRRGPPVNPHEDRRAAAAVGAALMGALATGEPARVAS